MILTAVHCLYSLDNPIIFDGEHVHIHAGATDQTENNIGQRIQIDEVITYNTYPELAFKETQQIYLDFLSHRDTSLVDVLDKNTLYTLGSKKHEYAGFSRSVYSEITGEIIPVTTPKLGESEPRTRKDNFTQHWTVSPNPFHSLLKVTLFLDTESKTDVTVYNTLGMIQHQSFDVSNMIEIQTDSWEKGVYFMEVKMDNKIQGFSKLVKL